MIISWNVRGLNKAGKNKDVALRLLKISPAICILVETRVKEDKASAIRNKLGAMWAYSDNYEHHGNGRIWIMWNETKVQGDFIMWCTAIYAHNAIERRYQLWKDIEGIATNTHDSWMLFGDFNNVLSSSDRIGGNPVLEKEFKALEEMMLRTGLYVKDSIGDHYTWFNNQCNNPVYSRIDWLLGNSKWHQDNQTNKLHVMQPERYRKSFKFPNIIASEDGFLEAVEQNWKMPLEGQPMYRVWRKLYRLQKVILDRSKDIQGISQQISQARENLSSAQQDLIDDRLNADKIQRAKECLQDIIHLTTVEENILRQRSKVNWIKLGDSNNAYFHATLKSKFSNAYIGLLKDNDGNGITDQKMILKEVTEFYRALVGKPASGLNKIDLEIMREGKQLQRDQCASLTALVTEGEIHKVLKKMSDLTAPGIDGYGAKFFKSSWNIIKIDLCMAVKDFFENGRLYRVVNNTVVTIIPKNAAACSIVNVSQAAFIPGQHIQDHIMLAYELIRGYSAKNGPPRCMIQMGIKKAYDSVDWYKVNNELSDNVQAKRGLR
ncbi:uncharacterized protein LOC131632454 [Vicia villosa]|uniref:uncharacterized protein LOC131632454 n=1 Tax=Vicia villosa TaxID=3911 RepID=UPI00273C8024|nr:uncharacterized protein LOC131632454 [Vicia villosa]